MFAKFLGINNHKNRQARKEEQPQDKLSFRAAAFGSVEKQTDPLRVHKPIFTTEVMEDTFHYSRYFNYDGRSIDKFTCTAETGEDTPITRSNGQRRQRHGPTMRNASAHDIIRPGDVRQVSTRSRASHARRSYMPFTSMQGMLTSRTNISVLTRDRLPFPSRDLPAVSKP